MILVDTSVWIDHLRRGDPQLARLLERTLVVTHPFVVGEIACGSLSERTTILDLLQELPSVVVADNVEALAFIQRYRLHGRGIGLVDVHLLASVALTPGSSLWTRDKRLQSITGELGFALSDAPAR